MFSLPGVGDERWAGRFPSPSCSLPLAWRKGWETSRTGDISSLVFIVEGLVCIDEIIKGRSFAVRRSSCIDLSGLSATHYLA